MSNTHDYLWEACTVHSIGFLFSETVAVAAHIGNLSYHPIPHSVSTVITLTHWPASMKWKRLHCYTIESLCSVSSCLFCKCVICATSPPPLKSFLLFYQMVQWSYYEGSPFFKASANWFKGINLIGDRLGSSFDREQAWLSSELHSSHGYKACLQSSTVELLLKNMERPCVCDQEGEWGAYYPGLWTKASSPQNH